MRAARAVAASSRSGRVVIVAPSCANAWMCGSRRRRPITSPPGGGTVARPSRASSGPASRKEARMRLGELLVDLVRRELGGVHPQFVRRPSSRRPRRGPRAARASSRRRGCAGRSRASTGSSVSRHAARIGSAPFLLPAARTRPGERASALDHERLRRPVLTTVEDRRRLCVAAPWRRPVNRPGNTHALHEERGAPAPRARRGGLDGLVRAPVGEDEEIWRVDRAAARLRLRDAPDARPAPAGRRADPARGGLPGGRDRGASSPTPSTSRCRATRRSRGRCSPATSCSGFVHACGLVRPTGLDGLEPKSVRKKLKQPSFAAGRAPRRGLRGRRAARARARRAHRERGRGAAADRGRARAATGTAHKSRSTSTGA